MFFGYVNEAFSMQMARMVGIETLSEHCYKDLNQDSLFND